jgi:hypothetical protein
MAPHTRMNLDIAQKGEGGGHKRQAWQADKDVAIRCTESHRKMATTHDRAGVHVHQPHVLPFPVYVVLRGTPFGDQAIYAKEQHHSGGIHQGEALCS